LIDEGRALQQHARQVPPQLARSLSCRPNEVAELTERLLRLRAQLLDEGGGPSGTPPSRRSRSIDPLSQP